MFDNGESVLKSDVIFKVKKKRHQNMFQSNFAIGIPVILMPRKLAGHVGFLHLVWRYNLALIAGHSWCLRWLKQITSNKETIYHMPVLICWTKRWWAKRFDFSPKVIPGEENIRTFSLGFFTFK